MNKQTIKTKIGAVFKLSINVLSCIQMCLKDGDIYLYNSSNMMRSSIANHAHWNALFQSHLSYSHI